MMVTNSVRRPPVRVRKNTEKAIYTSTQPNVERKQSRDRARRHFCEQKGHKKYTALCIRLSLFHLRRVSTHSPRVDSPRLHLSPAFSDAHAAAASAAAAAAAVAFYSKRWPSPLPTNDVTRTATAAFSPSSSSSCPSSLPPPPPLLTLSSLSATQAQYSGNWGD